MKKKPSKKRTRSVPRVKRKEAIWLDGPVPNEYWHYLGNRTHYMRWLGQEFGFKKIEDWYQITTTNLKQTPGGGSLLNYWGSSIFEGVKETFPDHDWLPWLFRSCPRAFWSRPANHRRFMAWLEQQLGIKSPEEWYRVTNRDFKEHRGGGFLTNYQSTISLAIMKYRPKHAWKEWMFSKTPKGFWTIRRNRVRYMKWLAQQLNIKVPQIWYRVRRQDFGQYYGNQFIKFYDGSPNSAVKDCFPRVKWHEWMFSRVPVGFWLDPNNRKDYVRWLGRQLKIRNVSDWNRVRSLDIKHNYGGGLLHHFDSYIDLIKECVPGFEETA